MKTQNLSSLVLVALCLVISLLLSSCNLEFTPAKAQAGQTRTYYLAADEVDWDYAPSYPHLPIMDMSQMSEHQLETAAVFLENGADRIGHVYRKAIYREYTDATFAQQKPRPAEWEHLGLLGPTLHAEVGDTIQVVFKNNSSWPFGIHPHGVFYAKDSEGTPYADGTSGSDKADDAVAPGATHTYTWQVPERAGPGPNDPSSIVWFYHSHTDEVRDIYSGLVGALVITAKGKAKPDGSPKGVDREFVTLFHVFDENNSLYLDHNIQHFAQEPATVDVEDEGFVESNLMHAINGYVYGDLPGLTMKKGERTRWYVLGMGTEVDLHTPHWHGNTGLLNGNRVDVIEVLPASMKVVDIQPDNAGIWMFHCHVNDHILAGMMAVYMVEK